MRRRAQQYQHHHFRHYGITRDEYEARCKQQGGLCACCGKTAKLCVDHIHGTRIIRGLLCRTCNLGIGHLGDNAEGVERALLYLRRT